METRSLVSRQIWAVLRRYFIVMLYYPFRSSIRVAIWPALIIGPTIYFLKDLDPSHYGFGALITSVQALVFFITLPHFYSFIDSMVTDKANGMKSLMLSMGLRRINYYIAMSISFVTLVLPLVMILMVVLKLHVLDDSISWFSIIGFPILFTLHLDALIAAGVSFITSSSYSFVIPVFTLVIEQPFIERFANFIIDHITGQAWKGTILFFLSYSPYEVMRLFFDNYADTHKNPHHGPLFDQELLTQETWLLYTAQAFWIIFFRLFAYWFEEVCPWQNVSAVRSFCFCLNRRKGRVSEGDSMLETPSSASKYFEVRSNERHEVGVRVNHVTKTYNKQIAVNDVSFTIYRGETTLLLGHNGAGKSTLMNIILGLLEPNDGYVKVNTRSGQGPTSLGVCPQTSILDNDLTVKQHLELFNDIKSQMTGSERARHINQTLIDVSLDVHSSKRPSELSGGMKRKLSLGMAFVGKSDVLILDEPSSGLDPDSRMFVWNAIRRYRSDRTVLLSTQHMEEADYLGDRIAIMSSGRIVCCGSSVYLNKLFGTGYKLRIECKLSKKNQILDHVAKNYFDAVQPVDVGTGFLERPNTDPIVDLVLELKTKDQSRDSELELIRLLQDFENNAGNLSIRSYGLKSSSIEDVMLNTSKYFASLDVRESEHSDEATSRFISALTSVNIKSHVNLSAIIWAILSKHAQVHISNWLSVLVLKIGSPILGIYIIISNLNGIPSALFWQNPSLALIVGHLIYFPVRERGSKFKIMQFTSNATVWMYWVSQFLFDLIWIIIPMIAAIIFIGNHVPEPMVSKFKLYGLIELATLLFYLASLTLCYCISNVISNARSSIGYFYVLAIIPLALSVVVYIFRSLVLKAGETWLQDLVGYICLAIYPTDAYAYFYYGIGTGCYMDDGYHCRKEGASISAVTVGLVALTIQIVAYSLLLALIEFQSFDIEWYCRFRNIFPCFFSSINNFGENREVDRDVLEETTKALAAIKDHNSPYALVAAQLNKSYVQHNKIIENLSFTVNKGECFGLLGVNGAGKTTTFSMLATETAPDSGRILANGFYSEQDLHAYRKKFGYDPQATPELSLSPYQALYLMARLRGIDELSIPTAVDSVLHLLDMTQHTHKNDQQLSGGTKRKLALGMALIGNPAILTLDEPTAGVDPLARRSIWQLLKSLRTRNESSIIISSHAMEECEAICDRIAIMARGRLRCIGTFLHLRSKFAKGCTLRVQFSKGSIRASSSSASRVTVDSAKSGSQYGGSNGKINAPELRRSSTSSATETDKLVEQLQQQLEANIGQSTFQLADRNVNSVTFNITDNRVRRSILFRMMRDFRQQHPTVSYMINDSSLEDIFISLAREQQELEQNQRLLS